MNRSRLVRLCSSTVLAALFLLAPRCADAIIIELTGTTDQLLYDQLGGLEGPAMDPVGNLYVLDTNTGIREVTQLGAMSPWSSTKGYQLTFAPDGTGYALESACNCIEQFTSSGQSSVLRPDTLAWGNFAVLPDGSLWANVWLGTGQGIYRIDRTTGEPTVVVAGGPGPGGSGIYYGMTPGTDGRLYVNANLDGTLAGSRIFRLDGSTLTPMAAPPNGGRAYAPGPPGWLLVISGVPGSLYTASELWLYDPVAGTSKQVARTDIYFHEYDVSFRGVAYDPSQQTAYVTENHRLWALHLDLSTPALARSWGAVKAQYRK